MVTKTLVFEMFLSIKFEYILCTKKQSAITKIVRAVVREIVRL